MSFSFNGVQKDYIRILKGFERPAFAPIEHESISFPGVPGVYITGVNRKSRPIDIPVEIKASNTMSLFEAVEDMLSWLTSDRDGELILPGEHNRTYYARLTGDLQLREILNRGKGTISFICADSHKYGPDDSTLLTELTTITNTGTAQMYPKFMFTVTEPITHLNIISDNTYMRLGRPVSVIETPFERETVILNDNCSNLVGWAQSATIEDGTVSGLLKTDGYYFYTNDYGTGSGWHGPTMKKSLSVPVVDFKLEVFLQQFAREVRTTGRAEVSILDANNKTVAKVTMKKTTAGALINIGVVRAGNIQDGHDLINWTGEQSYTWNDFDGILRVLRIGRYWEAYIAKVDKSNRHHSASWNKWTDEAGVSTTPITQVQVHLGIHGTTLYSTQKIDNIRVIRYNDNLANQVPYIAYPGDIIEVDFKTRKILLNGEERMDLKGDFGSSYFPLKPGENTIMLEPADKVVAECFWKGVHL